MTKRQFKKKIREAFSHGTPDISQEILMDTLLSDPMDRESLEIPVKAPEKAIRFPIFSAAAVACAVIAVLAISINLMINSPQNGSRALITAEEALNSVYTYPFDKPAIAVEPIAYWELDSDDHPPHYDITLSYPGTEFYFVVDAKTLHLGFLLNFDLMSGSSAQLAYS